MKQRILRLLFFLSCVAGLPACATLLRYSAEPIEARVIDADTNHPLEGVIVVAHWSLRADGIYPGGSPYAGELMVMETVTDKEGRFALPGWGPTTVWGKFLESNVPELILFKSGYHYKRLFNQNRTDFEQSVRRSEWNGRTVKLSRAKNNIIQDGPFVTSEYAKQLTFVNSAVGWAYREECELKKIPRMALALHRQKQEFKARKLENSLPSLDFIFDAAYPDPCGLRAVFGGELRR